MGYYLRMEEILSLQLKSQEQIERWKEELQEVGKTLEVLGDTNELQGEAGTKLKDNMKKYSYANKNRDRSSSRSIPRKLF